MAIENGNGNSVRLSTVVIQVVVAVILSGAAAFVGVLQGSAVVKVQMVEIDRRVASLEAWRHEITKQQIEMYRTQVSILEKQLETDKMGGRR
jgi:hypothetical protein